MASPIITLTTDFGLSDHYVGTMKGVILGICPDARIVDISHFAAPYSILEGAYLIAQAWRYFPAGTVHTVVVDPGVGSSRRAIIMEAGGHFFVAPDNGVLGLIDAAKTGSVRVISQERYFLQPVSRTFHGRDVFAPVAAHLATGEPPARFGQVITDYVLPPLAHPVDLGNGEWRGCILRIDHFGNIVTNFRASDFPALGSGPFELRIGAAAVTALATHYAESPSGELFAITGSSGYVEVSVARGSAAEKIACHSGDEVFLFAQA